MNRIARYVGIAFLLTLGLVMPAVHAQQPVAAEPQAPSGTVQAPREVVPPLPVPRLVKFAGTFKDELGKARTGVVGVTFAIYKEQEGGAALWLETQNLELDEQGRYTVLLGSTKSEGLPLELFIAGEPRWLGVQANLPKEVEQPRVLLVSVPYALKAADAETLGGKPLSSFVLASPSSGGGAGVGTVVSSAGGGSIGAATIGGGGTQNFVTKFDATGANVINSSLFDNGQVGIGTTNPQASLDVQLATGSATNALNSTITLNNSTPITGSVLSAFKMTLNDMSTATNLSKQPARFVYLRDAAATGGVTAFDAVMTATSFLTGDAPYPLRGVNIEGPTIVSGKTLFNFTGLYIGSPSGAGAVTNKFALVTEPNAGNVGLGTTTPTQKLEVAGNVKISGAGNALTFPDGSVMSSAATGVGGGTITGVAAGAGLTGGGTAGGVTLSIANGGVTDANIAAGANIAPSKIAGTAATLGANSFTGNQGITGNLTVTGVVSGNGSGLTNVNVGVVVPSGFSILGAVPVPPSGGFSNAGWLALSGQQPWATHATMPTARYFPAEGVVNGKIYVIGGFNSSGYLTTVEEYTPLTDTWATKAPMPTARFAAAAAVANGIIYVIGGNNGSTLATVEAYTPATNTWTTEATMPAAHYGMTAGAVNGKVYAFGGLASAGTIDNHTYAYDPSTNTWSVKTAMPTARWLLASVAVNNLIYVIGGQGAAFNTLPTTEAYDPTADAWTTKASMSNPRFGPAAETLSGLIYAFGGVGNGYLSVAEVYDPVSDAWFPTAPMPTARYGLVEGAVNNTIYAIGGYNGAYLSTNEQFDPSKLMYLFKKN